MFKFSLLIPLLFFMTITMAKAQTGSRNERPKMTFEEIEKFMGNVTKGTELSHRFKFQNTGSAPLIVFTVRGDEDITDIKWPKDPIPPGEHSEISFKCIAKPAGSERMPSKHGSCNINVTSNSSGNSRQPLLITFKIN